MDGTVVINTEINTKSFNAQIDLLENKLETLTEEYEAILKSGTLPDDEVKKYRFEIEKTINKLIKLKETQDKLNNDSHDNGEKQEKNFENIGKSIQKVTKRIGKMVLAVFGIRSAFMFVRNAINTITANDEQLKADIDYMRNALAYTIEPLVRKIVEWAKQLMTYIGYIVQKWTGKNIFENANKSLENSNKNAQKLKKTLAGFDEMNIVGDNSSDTGTVSPSFDLTSIGEGEIPEWVKWIAEHATLFKNIGGWLLAAFGASAVSKILKNIGRLMGTSSGTGLLGLSSTVFALAAIDTVLIYFVIKGVEQAIQEMNKFTEVVKNNKKASDKNKESHKELIDSIMKKIDADELDAEQTKTTINWLKNRINETKTLNETLEEQKTFTGYLNGANKDLEKQQQNLRSEIIKDVEAWEKLAEAGKLTTEEQEDFNKKLEETIISLGNAGINVNQLKAHYEKLTGQPWTIKLKADTYEAINNVERLTDAMRRLKDTFFNFSFGAGFGGGSGGGHGFAKGGIIYHNLPKLASGGIINQPGRGVPLGSAIGGERGVEGVLPLTDSQRMALLGESIGKYITIYANITNTMNGRVISRELQRVQNDSNFAYNR